MTPAPLVRALPREQRQTVALAILSMWCSSEASIFETLCEQNPWLSRFEGFVRWAAGEATDVLVDGLTKAEEVYLAG